jgi:hypothetical protein
MMRLALKAQGQCRATLETLAVLKNPPTVFAKQANIAAGSQQVNNTLAVAHQAPGETLVRARAENRRIEKKEMLEAHDERLDAGTTETPGRNHQALPPVGTNDRTANGCRETGQR